MSDCYDQISGPGQGCMVGVSGNINMSTKSRYRCGKGGFPQAMCPGLAQAGNACGCQGNTVENFSITGSVRPSVVTGPTPYIGVL